MGTDPSKKSQSIPTVLPVGFRINDLTVVGHHSEGGRRGYVVLCDCGTKKIVRQKSNLLKSKSCGCRTKILISEARTVHGMSKTPTWVSWKSMLDRCNRERHKSYKDYGGRGIEVCDRWQDFQRFFEDMGERPKGLTLERIDTNRGYYPENCCWASKKEQANNRRSSSFIDLDGLSRTVAQWSDITGIRATTIDRRIRAGWSVRDALTTPVRGQKNNVSVRAGRERPSSLTGQVMLEIHP